MRGHLESGSVLLSRAVSSQVPSALKGLTSVFGMGTGGSLSLSPPEYIQGLYPENRTSKSQTSSTSFSPWSLDQVLDRLVSPGSKPYGSSTGGLSPGSLPGVLLLSNGTLLLEVGFTLRCLQRLSLPHFASLLCRWHDNSCTSDASTPVLSY